MSARFLIALVAGLIAFGPHPAAAGGTVVTVGSKKFTESVILGEIARQALVRAGVAARHRQALGGTRILWEALLRGDIDVYAEYTGTLIHEILAADKLADERALTAALRARGVVMSAPLGFNNSYGIAVLPATARRLRLKTISDLARVPGLRPGLSNEFLNRADGWPALAAAYGLGGMTPRGLDHDLAYRALAAGDIDAMDVYTTDAGIAFYGLDVLADDRHHFPRYQAVWLYRTTLEKHLPGAVSALQTVVGRIDEPAMRRLNRAVKIDRRTEAAVATRFLGSGEAALTDRGNGWLSRLLRNGRDHIRLVVISLAAAIVIALPLGIVAAYRPAVGRLVLGVVGVVQTVPTLALLVFMIPLMGIGGPPAIVALFLYSLLPIVRNTHAGLVGIDPPLRESATALGLSPGARLRAVELPLALPSILAGIRTAAVINVGTATLGALIGAGGFGQPILTGIRLADTGLILEGAVPAALLALIVEAAFEGLERLLVSPGLRQTSESP